MSILQREYQLNNQLLVLITNDHEDPNQSIDDQLMSLNGVLLDQGRQCPCGDSAQ